MNLAGEEEKETCTGKRLRSHDSTTAWGSSSSDAADAAGETERTLTKHARRRPAGAQAAEMEPAQKKRLREGKLKEDEQEKSVKQKLEGDPDAANPHDPQLPGAPPPGATAQEESTQPNLTRGAGYDTKQHELVPHPVLWLLDNRAHEEGALRRDHPADHQPGGAWHSG